MQGGTEIRPSSSPIEDSVRSCGSGGAEPAFRASWRPAWRRRLAALLASACLFCARRAVAGGGIEYNTPAQRADKALILLGQQASMPGLYLYDDVPGKTSRAVTGTYT